MQPHIKEYTDKIPSHTGYYPCEVCNSHAVDIHHINRRSEFGSKFKSREPGCQDHIDNLIALCRPCHDKAHANEITKEQLFEIHQKRLKVMTKKEYNVF